MIILDGIERYAKKDSLIDAISELIILDGIERFLGKNGKKDLNTR